MGSPDIPGMSLRRRDNGFSIPNDVEMDHFLLQTSRLAPQPPQRHTGQSYGWRKSD
jgi:hypothetical protein